MNKQDQAEWDFWRRVAGILGTHLHSYTYQHSASFVNPQMEVGGKAAAKLIEQDDEITRLKGELAAMRFNNA